MSVETHLDRARERASNERAAVAAKRESLADFAAHVRQRSPGTASPESNGRLSGGGGVAARTVSQGTDELEQVRSAFAETVGEYTAADSVLASLQGELGEEAALALAPTTNAAFTTELQQQLLSRTTARRRELAATLTALDGERDSLECHGQTVDAVVSWVTTADETPLSELGFDELRARHERLDQYRAECGERAQTRQEWVAATTSHGGRVGVTHRSLVESLYEDFPVEYPVLATLTRLRALCEDCQETVRAHLVRRA